LHGLFGNSAFRHAWLTSLGWIPKKQSFASQTVDQLERSLTYLADEVEMTVSIREIERII
jgi:cobyric acid synthase